MAAKKKVKFTDLVGAYFDVHFAQHSRQEVQDYYEKRLVVLEKAFGFRLADREQAQFGRPTERRRGLLPAAHPADDRNQARDLARRCLIAPDRASSPFWNRMEGVPGPIEVALEKRHRRSVVRAFEKVWRARSEVSKRLRVVFADAVAMIQPGIERISFDEDALVRKGLPTVLPPSPCEDDCF